MNQQEFNAWVAETKRSRGWQVDPIHLSDEDFLAFKGEENGQFVIVCNGRVQMGDYEGAIPHIGEAEFTIKFEWVCGDAKSAFDKVGEVLGNGFMLDMLHHLIRG